MKTDGSKQITRSISNLSGNKLTHENDLLQGRKIKGTNQGSTKET